MKAIKLISTLTILLFIQSCGNKVNKAEKKTELNPRTTRSFEIVDGDTVNRNDISRRRQGHWKIRVAVASDKTVQAVYTGEPGVQTKILKNDIEWLKLEEGNYIDGKREGIWKSYFPSGRLKDSITYKDDVVVN